MQNILKTLTRNSIHITLQTKWNEWNKRLS